MAIEPLNSAMTYQAQTVKTQTVTPVNTDVSGDVQSVNVDSTTASVVKTQPEKEQDGSESIIRIRKLSLAFTNRQTES